MARVNGVVEVNTGKDGEHECLQARDQEAITRAFAERDRADEALERARNYLR